MKKKNRKNAGWRLFLLMLAVLFPAFMPGRTISATSIPETGTLSIHNYALEDMDQQGEPNDGNETTDIPEGAIPLEGIEFTIYQVNPTVSSNDLSVFEARKNLLSETKQVGITNADGEVVFQVNKGQYYVEVTDNASLDSLYACEPFLVFVPMSNPEGDGWITDVHVYPKSQSLFIDKFAGEAGDIDYNQDRYLDGKNIPVSANVPYGLTIFSRIPAGMGTVADETYIIEDDMDAGIQYIEGSMKVYTVPAIGWPTAESYILEESDYKITHDGIKDILTIEFTAAGIKKLGSRYSNEDDRYVMLKYDSYLEASAPQGISISGTTFVEHTRNITSSDRAAGRSMSPASNNGNDTIQVKALSYVAFPPSVHSGKIGITHLEAVTEKEIPGVEVGIARSKEEAEDGDFIALGVTDEHGKLQFRGLSYGKPGDTPAENSDDTSYWIIETYVPDEYELMEEPYEITFDYQLDNENGAYYFARATIYKKTNGNGETPGQSDTETPSTGGKTDPAKTGDTSIIYIFTGIALISMAAIIFFYTNRRKRTS